LRGYLDQAVPLLDEVMATTDDPIVRADAALLRGQAETWRAGPRRGYSLLTAEAEAVEAHDPDRAAGLLAHAVTAAMLEGDIKRAVGLARQAVDVAAAATWTAGAGSVAASLALAHALLLHGQAAEASALLDPLQLLADALAGSGGMPEAEHLVQAMGLLDLLLEEWDRGERRVEDVIQRARRLGTPGVLAFSSAVLAEICWRTGRWAEAHAVASSDVQEALGGEDPAARAFASCYLARIEAGLGNIEACRRTATEALAAGTRLGMGSVQVFANSALGFLELGLGNAEAALVHLDQIARAANAWELRNPGIVWWSGDHLEACWRAGRIDETRRRVEELEEAAEATQMTWARGVAARGRGLLAGEARFEDEFAASLASLEQAESPFEQARTRLCRGERRQQVGRHADGDLDLQAAMSVFERLGARPWAERARSLLGGHVAVPTRPALTLLTPSELRVALAVGHGSSNRAAAEGLYVSVKTVDFHLQNIYRKLGLRSRTELAVLVARAGVAS
jgi:DNA-binding CsgD family transcriptional regulator